MDTVRIGVIGTGAMGMGHITNYKAIPGFTVAAVCDVREEALARAKDATGAPGFADYRKLLDQKDVDAVAVVTPNFLHAPIAVAALEAGKHVFLEKPMAYDVPAARTVIAARDKAKKFVQLGVCVRFGGNSQVVREHIEAGELGKIYFAKCGYTRRNGIPGMGSWFTTMAKSGGGPIVDLGVHALDLTMWLMGNFEPVSVAACKYAEFGPKGRGGSDWGTAEKTGTFDVEDLAAALIRFQDGATAFVEVSWAMHMGGGGMYSQIFGDKGGAQWDPATIFTDEFGKPVDKKLSVPSVDFYRVEHEHFLASLRANRAPMPTLEQGLAVQAVLDAIKASAANCGETVPVVM